MINNNKSYLERLQKCWVVNVMKISAKNINIWDREKQPFIKWGINSMIKMEGNK